MRIKFAFAVVLITCFITGINSVYGQATKKEAHRPQLRGAIMMANSHIPKATEGGKKVAVIPTWGFDVDYFFNPLWSVAFQGDVKLQSFEIEYDGAQMERSFPTTLATVIHFHPVKHWSFYTGPGIEIERHKNLYLFKLGTEYSFEVSENFEIALNLIYENKEDIYDSWTFGIAFNKKLWEKSVN